jgi:Sec-independent protein secretion pathway component TatC
MVNTGHGIVEDFMTWTFKLLIHSQVLVFLGLFFVFGVWFPLFHFF